MTMNCIFLTEASPGAPALSGTNGALCAVLDWALAQKGWAVEYTATNARVYRAASGNRHRLSVRHDSALSGSAALATVRGCESATSATSLTDPFPTSSQLADNAATWLCSEAASTATRQFRMVVADTWFILRVKHGSADNWATNVFGDMPKTRSEDVWNTLCTSHGTGGITFAAGLMVNIITAGPAANSVIFWARSIDGSIKSTRGMLVGSGANSMPGALSNFPSARAGYGNRIERECIAVGCCGGSAAISTTLSILKRGFLPNSWFALHADRGGLTSTDTHTDTAYAAGSVFRVIPSSTSGFHLIEETDTWSPPSG